MTGISIRAFGPWFFCAQKITTVLGTMYGFKIYGLAFYFRWNVKKKS